MSQTCNVEPLEFSALHQQTDSLPAARLGRALEILQRLAERTAHQCDAHGFFIASVRRWRSAYATAKTSNKWARPFKHQQLMQPEACFLTYAQVWSELK
ncbi:hypothetical protein CWO90_30445 [Bradyrhizobium sp. Leo121]|nr:hypothetical protein CWO90_30445 [Bradyrhizobium sp. Leo121]